LNLYPSDYKINRDLCWEEFHAQGFPKNEVTKRFNNEMNIID
jgi:hypothetical protein